MKLIFIHGSGGSRKVWHYQTQHFPDAEAINLPGHPQGEPYSSVEDYTDWLHRYILQQEYSRPVLIGHSLGSAIAQEYALEYPEDTKALVLIGAGTRLRVAPQFLSLIHEGMENPSVWLKNFVEPLYCRIVPEVKEKLIREIAQIGPAVQLNDMLCCDKFDILDRVHQIKVPTLILCGSEDQMTPPKYSSYLANKIEGAELVMIDGGTHLAFAEMPETVNQEIDKFLSKL
jgi:pimeloyl-ACP methyl ester carboxylesterase